MRLIDILADVLSKFLSAIPNIIGAIIVIIAGLLIAKAVAKAIEVLLQKAKVDRLGDRLNAVEMVANADVEIKFSVLISRVVYYVLVLIFLVVATDVLGMEVVSVMVADLIAYVPRLIAAVVLLIIGLLLAEGIKKIVLAACRSLKIPSANIIATFVFYLVFITLLISALAQAGIATDLITSNLTVILSAIAFAFALGYGLASRDTMANFLASFYSKNKIRVGDTIRLDGAKGRVIAQDNTSVTIQGDNAIVIIPLQKLHTDKLEIFRQELPK